MITLGAEATDIITGFSGVAIGRAQYLTGCTQVLVVPQTLDKDGKRRDGEWFDEQRLKSDGKVKVTLDNGSIPGLDERQPSATK